MSNFLRSLKQIGKITYLGGEKVRDGAPTPPVNANYAIVYLDESGALMLDNDLEINKTELNGNLELYSASALSKIINITSGSIIYYRID